MPITPTYPGVYIEEVPSGVRTITGVSTSVAVFIGRARRGPMNTPTLCLNYSDFERTFSSDYGGSEMARSVLLFFQNGGTQCYAMRIAEGATASEVTLRSETGVEVLLVRSKSPGLLGDSIRMAVTYNGLDPESTFNLEVFRWGTGSGGQAVKEATEKWQSLSMDPTSPRYAQQFVNQNSNLINLDDLNVAPSASGYSQSGRAIPSRTNTIFRGQMVDLIGAASVAGSNRFRIGVDGGTFVEANLSAIDFSQAPLDTVTNIRTNLAAAIKAAIDPVLTGGAQVEVSFETGPAGPNGEDNETTDYLRVASTNGDVKIEPAGTDDLAGPLMLGTAQGGIEVSRYASNRPAANGMVFNLDSLVDFGSGAQDAFNTFPVDSTVISLGTSLQTAGGTSPRMYQDGYSPSSTGNSDGVREKWAIIATAINNERAANPAFKWSAEVWGSRLVLIPGEGGDNSQGTLSSWFVENVRYYSLGPSGQGSFQTPSLAPASDGSAPTLSNYRSAFAIIDKQVDLFNLMVLPADEDHTDSGRASLWGPASVFCQQRRAFLLMDAPAWQTVQEATNPATGVNGLRVGLVKDHSSLFYPRLLIRENGLEIKVGASRAIAGLIARIDANRGVWKAPAGVEASLRGVVGIENRLSDSENGVLNPRAINTLRVFPSGIVNWGARTMDGDDDFGSEYKYIPVRRLALFIEESLFRGTQWVVFEPNDEPLWAQIRLNLGAFMHSLFRQGAFQGTSPKEAYFVKCDKETTTQDDINRGIVNIVVGFAPLKPAEFVIIKIQQIAGQIEV